MNARRLIALLPLAALAVASCGDDDPAADSTTAASERAAASTTPGSAAPDSTAQGSTTPASAAPTTTTPAPPELDGREFVSTAVVGYELVPDSEVRLTFDGDRINAAAGCNQLVSTWALEGDVLVVADMASTLMACEPAALMDQDTWLSSFLTSDPVVALAGDMLTLTVGPSSITLLDREVAEPDQSLEGPTWTLDSIVSADAVSSVPVGVRPPTLTFAAGEVAVDTGCNTGSGGYQATDTDIMFEPIALTRIGCDEATAQVELAITTLLDGVVAYAIEADQLTLTKGDQGLIYRTS